MGSWVVVVVWTATETRQRQAALPIARTRKGTLPTGPGFLLVVMGRNATICSNFLVVFKASAEHVVAKMSNGWWE
jgi:hypothetical protein